MNIECPWHEASHARENLISGLDPDERLWIRMMRIDKFANGGFELGHAAVDPRRNYLLVSSANQRSTGLCHASEGTESSAFVQVKLAK